ncbi:DUF3261 domain-containing protein [Pseudomonas sp. J452]|uniref:DUF3261 domain-containing protein n=1 Tax=Pseudomonas sp. J452 TaxID=2898441 RepID=UPI0021AD9DB0|nr:DUF3261 domain-containing protein [Pseudomonas sp. J452]UUY09894.1 DUF3261 domain-containing protein [Pseudomonas sp. J452]
MPLLRCSFVLLLGLLLGACASRTPLPAVAPSLSLPLSLHIQRAQAGASADWLLVVQAEGTALRWSLFDPLGVPLARQLLDHGQWRNDGLLPPNAEARELFAALLFALTPSAELAQRYPQGDWQLAGADQRRLDPDWRIDYRTPLHFTLNTPPDLHYRVAPLQPEAQP